MTGPNVGFATLSVIPSLRGFEQQLSRELGGPLQSSSKKAGDGAGGSFMGGFAGVAKAGALAAGAAIGAVIAKGVSESIAREASADKVAAAFGLNPEEQARLGELAGSIYADAYGESFGQVAETVAGVEQVIGRLDENADIQGLTENALDFATAFDTDVNEAINAASLLLSNDLVDNGTEAFDLLVAASQDLPSTVRDELLAATQEYSTYFSDLGLSGTEAFGAIVLAAEEGGSIGVDKLGDAVKEFGIRATDVANTDVAGAFETIGADAEDMGRRILEGGGTARDAFYEIVVALRQLEDPLEQQKAAIALFGTPLEDLSSGEIPEFLANLDNMGDALGNVEGAADNLGNTLNDNAATKIEAFKRGALQSLTDFVEDDLLPAAQDFGAYFEENLQPALEDAGDFVANELVPTLAEFYGGVAEDLTPALIDLWETVDADVLPVFEDLWHLYRDDVLPAAAAIWEFVANYLIPVVGFLAEKTAESIGNMIEGYENLKSTVGSIVETAQNVYTDVTTTLGDLVSFIAELPGKVSTAASGIWDGITNGLVSAVNFVIDTFNKLDLKITIPDVPGVPGRGETFDLIPDLPRVGTQSYGERILGGAIPVFHLGGVFNAPLGQSEGLALLSDQERVLSPSETRDYDAGRTSATGTKHENHFHMSDGLDERAVATHVAYLVA